MSLLAEPIHKDDHYRRKPDAPCTLVEYGDYESSRCLYARHIVKELERDFGSDLLFVFRHFPALSTGPYAQMAAETSEFAATHGMFWEMHELLYQSQERDGTPAFQELAEALGLDPVELLDDLERQKFAKRVANDVRGAWLSGVAEAPTFFINGKRYEGPIELAHMSATVRSVLSPHRKK